MAATLHRHTGADTGPSGDCSLVQASRAASSLSPLLEGRDERSHVARADAAASKRFSGGGVPKV